MSNEECTALLFRIDHHIPTKSKDVAIQAEFEQIYQRLLRNLTHVPDNGLTSLKSKLRSTCKIYSKINVSTRNGICKLKWRIARLMMETELQNQDRQKRNLWKDIRSINVFLSTSLSVIVYNALLHQANIAVKSRIKVIKKTSQLVIQTRNNQLQWWT